MIKESGSEICSKCNMPLVACKCGKAETALNKREIYQPIVLTFPEMENLLKRLPRRKKIGVLVRDFTNLYPLVLTVARLAQMLKKVSKVDSRFLVKPFEIVTTDPPDDFVETYKSQEGQRDAIWREEDLKAMIEHNRENLKDYSDDQLLLVTDESSRSVTGALRITASQARRLNETMRDPDNSLTLGYATLFVILSDDPEAFFEQEKAKFRQDQKKALGKLEGFKENVVAWYIEPMDKFRNSEIYKTTVRELRKKIFEFRFDDWVDDRQQGVVTFPKIISVGDDAFDGEEYMEEKQRQHTAAFYQAIENVTGRIEKADLTVSDLLSVLDGRDADGLVTLTATKSKTKKNMTVRDARDYLLTLPTNFIETEGGIMIS